MQWLIIGLFVIFGGLLAVAEQADKDDYKSGKQKKEIRSSGPYRWTEDGQNVKIVVGIFFVIFILIILLLGG
jgi:hypothetical protein